MATSVHGDGEGEQVEEPEDGYWPALEILNERKLDYLVNWDGLDPATGKAWAPSWTKKSEVTEDLIEVWKAKKAAKKKGGRRAPDKSRKPRAFVASTPRKPTAKNSRSSRTSLMSSSRAPDSPVISLTSTNSSRAPGEPSLGKRKRRSTRFTPTDEDPKPALKKQRVGVTSSSTSQKSRTKSIRSSKHINRETIREEEGDEALVEMEAPYEVEGPYEVYHSTSTSKTGTGSAVVRIGPPRKRKKLAPLPPASRSPSPRRSDSAFRHLRKEEEENTQEAAGAVPQPSPPTVRKKKRRLKPPSDVRPKPLVLAVEKPPPLRDASQDPQEPSDQEELFGVTPAPLDQDDEPRVPLPEPTPPRLARQLTPPDPLLEDDISTPASPQMKKKTTLDPVPKLYPSEFAQYLEAADTTSVIDEFSPMKSFPAQGSIESSIQDSQDQHTTTESLHQGFGPGPADDSFDVDIVKKMQDVQDAYFDLDGRANEVSQQEQPTTDPGSTEQDPFRSQSPAEHTVTWLPVQSFNSQELEGALVILNQKSEEIEGLKNRHTAQEAQIEHLQAENDRIQVEYGELSIKQEVQREALEEAKGTVSELVVHIDYMQGMLNQSDAELKQLQGEMDELRGTLGAKVEEHDLAQAKWEQERAALEERLTSFRDVPPQQPPAGWELEKKELEDKLSEMTGERDQLDKDKRSAENEVETWKETYKKQFMHSQELRQEAKDAKIEASRIEGENAIVSSQTKESVRLVTAKYEATVEKLKTELTKAESLYKVLQLKDERTGDDLRRRAMSATHLQEEVRRLREELAQEVAKNAAPVTELKGEGRYGCQFFVNGLKCDEGFGSPQELWFHVIDGHVPDGQQ